MKLLKRCSAALTLAAVLALSSGCYHHTYGDSAPQGPPTVSKSSHNILFGLISINAHTPGDVCGEAAPTHISTFVGPIGLLMSIVTAGIYVPTTTLVFCPPGAIPAAPAASLSDSAAQTGDR